jgi:hypothetical protein
VKDYLSVYLECEEIKLCRFMICRYVSIVLGIDQAEKPTNWGYAGTPE